jgi:hypothetical protein
MPSGLTIVVVSRSVDVCPVIMWNGPESDLGVILR